MSALPPKADIAEHRREVRFVPKADILHCGKKRRYSITSSARPSGGSEIVKPSARAVLSCVEPWRENCLQQLKLTFYTGF